MNHSATRINYNRMSRWYDLISMPEKQFKEAGLRLLDIHPGEKVLEIGFGTGLTLVGLAVSAGTDGKVFGIDLSEGMSVVAQDNIYRAKATNLVNLQQGDAINLPYKNNFFDAIYTSFTLELFDATDTLLVLRECNRVLRENGRIGVVALNHEDRLPVKIYNWFHERVPSIVDCHPIDVRNILETAGFKPIEVIEKAMVGLPVLMLTARKYGK